MVSVKLTKTEYEKLISAKDERIKALEGLVESQKNLIGVLKPSIHFEMKIIHKQNLIAL